MNRTHTKPMLGLRFGRLLVIAFDKRTICGKLHYLCRCDCGKEKAIDGQALRGGITVSCGCYGRTQLRRCWTHGKSYTPTYKSWANMIQRCTNPKNRKYHHYGGRGITVCDRWKKFESFLADMGESPAGYTIERNDNDGNYEPSNCRWATWAEQVRNKSNNHWIEFRGQKRLLRDWAADIGISHMALLSRLRKGWSLERALQCA